MSPSSTSMRCPSSRTATSRARAAIRGSTTAATLSLGSAASSARTTRVPMNPGNPVKRTVPPAIAGGESMWPVLSPENRHAHVVRGHDREQDGVEPVERPAVGPEEAPRVLHAEIAFDQRFEEVAERSGTRHGQADQEPVGAVEPLVLVPQAEEPEGEGSARDPREQTLDRLVRGDAGSELPPAPGTTAEVRRRVGHEGADQRVEHERAAVRQLAEQHGVRERKPDPDDPEHGRRDPPGHVLAPLPHEGEQEREKEREHGHEHDLAARPVERRQAQRRQREEAGQVDRSSAPHHAVELVHADHAERDYAEREHEAALGHDEHREDDRRDRLNDTAEGLAGHYVARAPYRRWRAPYSSSAAARSGVSDSISSANIAMRPSSSARGRLQFSVEKAYAVSSRTSSSTALRTVCFRACAPSRWPSSTGTPCSAAHRAFPSMMIAT